MLHQVAKGYEKITGFYKQCLFNGEQQTGHQALLTGLRTGDPRNANPYLFPVKVFNNK